MSTFWLVYWIALGIVIIFSLFVYYFFDIKESYNKYKPISIAYVLFAIMIGAIPGANCLGVLVLIIVILAGICEGELKPKENILEKKE